MTLASINSPTNQRIIAALKKFGPMCANDLAKEAHCSIRTLVRSGYLSQLLDKKEIHIARWVRGIDLDPPRSGPPVPIYAAGKKRSAPRPKRITDSERCKRFRDGPAGKAFAARDRIRRRGLAKAEPVLAALLAPKGAAA